MSDITDERIATALERIADALERAYPKFHPGGYVGGDYTLPEMPPRGGKRVVTREEIRAVLDAKPCDDRTCTDRDHWAPVGRVNHGDTPTACAHGQDHPDDLTCEYRCAATMPGHWCTRREHSDDRHVWAMSDEEAQRILRAGQELGFVAEADPLDESDHRPRHDRDGRHWRKGGRWWDTGKSGYGNWTLGEIAAALGPLTFCDCGDATIEAENGATD